MCKKSLPDAQILVSSRRAEKAEAFARSNSCTATGNSQIARDANMIFLGVKPHQMKTLLADLSPILSTRTAPALLVSMAAGLSTEQLESFLPFPCPVIRIMPNTPSMVGKGCILYALVEQRGICRNSPIARKALYVQKKHLRKQVLFCTPSDISLQLWE